MKTNANLQSIFTAYDVRGLYPKQINASVAYVLGRAFSVFSKEKFKTDKIAIGVDIRKSSEVLAKAFARGVVDEGLKPVDIGVVTTPMFYYAVARFFKSGVMITPSHLPLEYNGFKFSGPRAVNIGVESGLLDIENMYKRLKTVLKQNTRRGVKNLVLEGFGLKTKNFGFKTSRSFKTFLKIKPGSLLDAWKFRINQQLLNSYYEFFLKQYSNLKRFKFKKGKPLRLVVDTGNGCAFLDLFVLEKFFEVLAVNAEPDDKFPGRGPNPLIKGCLRTVKKLVRSVKADFGIAYDGDADRVVFIDKNGVAIPADVVGGVIGLHLFKKQFSKHGKRLKARQVNRKIIVDIRSSKAVFEVLERAGAEPIISKSGREFISLNMDRFKALFGLEATGHYFFQKFWNRDNGLMAVFELASVLKDTGKSLSMLIKPFQKYLRTGEISIIVKNRDKVLKRVENHFSNAEKVLLIDGVSMFFKDFWFNLRKSNTEPVLRLSVEARSKTALLKARRELLSVIDGKVLYSHF